MHKEKIIVDHQSQKMSKPMQQMTEQYVDMMKLQNIFNFEILKRLDYKHAESPVVSTQRREDLRDLNQTDLVEVTNPILSPKLQKPPVVVTIG